MKKISALFIAVSLLFAAGCDVKKETEQTPRDCKIVLAIKRDTTETIRNLIDRFTEENSGISVKIMELSDESVENHRVLGSVLAGNEVTVDVMMVEDIWMKEFVSVGYLRPIDAGIGFNREEYPRKISDIMYTDGEMYGIPLMLDAGIMLYRNDLTDGKLDYTELLRANSPEYSIQGVDKEEMICVVQECIRLAGGAEEGIELYKSLVEKSKYASDDYLSDFKSGKTAYARSWTSNYTQLQRSFTNIRGKVGTSLLSRGDNQYSTARAYFVSINDASDKSKAEEIKTLLRFLLREDIQLEIAKGTGTLPLKYRYYSSPVVCDYNEYNERFAKCLDKLNYRASEDRYTFLSEKAQSAVSRYISGETDVSEAAEAVKKTME